MLHHFKSIRLTVQSTDLQQRNVLLTHLLGDRCRDALGQLLGVLVVALLDLLGLRG